MRKVDGSVYGTLAVDDVPNVRSRTACEADVSCAHDRCLTALTRCNPMDETDAFFRVLIIILGLNLLFWLIIICWRVWFMDGLRPAVRRYMSSMSRILHLPMPATSQVRQFSSSKISSSTRPVNRRRFPGALSHTLFRFNRAHSRVNTHAFHRLLCIAERR